jgi:hypothetical protein
MNCHDQWSFVPAWKPGLYELAAISQGGYKHLQQVRMFAYLETNIPRFT